MKDEVMTLNLTILQKSNNILSPHLHIWQFGESDVPRHTGLWSNSAEAECSSRAVSSSSDRSTESIWLHCVLG